MKSLAIFVAGGVLVGLVGLVIGYLAWGIESLGPAATAFALAFVPAASTLAWVSWTYRAAPDMQLMASLGGSGVRMAIALGGGFLLTNSLPEFFDKTFWYWLLVFYLVLLGFEIFVLLHQQPKLNGSPHA
ncbi:MAG: hypothetical protein HYX68_27825 [Planctomycetes bacterium]|nr:hypothetical protein [Planctomycetota bacterium]